MPNYASILDHANDARTRIREVAPIELETFDTTQSIFLDVRNEQEFLSGHLPGAQQLDWTDINEHAAERIPDKSTPIIAYCAIGHRSAIAADYLQALGYTHVVSIAGGLQAYEQQLGRRKVA